MNERCLTVREPWASAVVDGHKPVENRSQGFPKGYRGQLWIHSAQQVNARGVTDPRITAVYGIAPTCWLGHVIGAVDVVDIHPASGCCEPWGEQTYPPANAEQRPPGVVTHIVMENPRRLRHPIPARGALGLWRPDTDLAYELNVARFV